ncbi:hypothetical protein Tco_1213284 [Tanacetum coccineum]
MLIFNQSWPFNLDYPPSNIILALDLLPRLSTNHMRWDYQRVILWVLYIDTRPNGDALRKCILQGPYTPSIVTIPAVHATNDTPAVPERAAVETILNMSPENKAHYESEKKAIHLVLTGIEDEIYSTIDACKTAHEIWIAIERLQQDPYYQAPKSHKPYAPTSKQSSSTRSNATTKYKGKEIAKPITPPSESDSKEDSDQIMLEEIRTSSNSDNKNVDTSPRYKNDNQTGQFGNQRTVTVAGKPKRVKDYTYHKEKMLMCKQAEKGVPLQVEQADWIKVMDEEIDELELEAHYNYMVTIQEDSEQPESISNTCVVEQVDSNVIPDSPDMCDNDIQTDQNAETCLMPLAIKTQNDSFKFLHELKQEMHADLKYVESLEKEIDELESDKAEFSNMYDILLQECVSNDVMCSYLHSLSDLDAHTKLQCLYLHKVKECENVMHKSF